MQEKLKIGEILVRTGLIAESQLRSALGEQARWGGRLGVTLVKLGFLAEEDLVRALGSHFGIPVVRLEGKRIAPEVLGLLPGDFAEKHRCMPLFLHWENGMEVLYLGMEDPGDLAVLDDVAFRTGLRVRPVLVGPVQVQDAIEELYLGRPGALETEAPEEPLAAPEPPPMEAGLSPVRPDDTAPRVERPTPTLEADAPPVLDTPTAPVPTAATETAPPALAPTTPQAPDPEVVASPASPMAPTVEPSYEQTFEPENDDGFPGLDGDETLVDADLSSLAGLSGAPELGDPAPGAPVSVPGPAPQAPPFEAVALPVAEEDPRDAFGEPGESLAPPSLDDLSALDTGEDDPEIEIVPPCVDVHLATPPSTPPVPESTFESPAPETATEPGAHAAPPVAPSAPAEPTAPLASIADLTPAESHGTPTPMTAAALEPPPASPVDPNRVTRPGSLGAPVLDEAPAVAPVVEPEPPSQEAAHGAEGAGNPTSTREILRAVTQLLIESGIFTREELMERVKDVRGDRRDRRSQD